MRAAPTNIAFARALPSVCTNLRARRRETALVVLAGVRIEALRQHPVLGDRNAFAFSLAIKQCIAACL